MSNQIGPETSPHRGAWLRNAAKQSLHTWGLATADIRPMPDFLLVGTKRGGTTSMHHLLLQHPDMIPMFPARRLKSPMYFSQHYDRGERWYRSHFPTSPYRRALESTRRRPTVAGEASPYYLYNPYAAQRIRDDVPDVKIVIMLRDPVRRAYSHYWERVDNGVEPLTFAEALAAEPQRLAGELDRMAANPLYYSEAHDWYSYRDRGLYADQLRRYFELFPRERVLIITSELFYRDEQASFDQITDFLGLPRHVLAAKPRYNYLPVAKMDPAIEAELIDFFRAPNEDVYTLLGTDLGWSR
jgi:sulfotransferase family protein